MNTRTTNERIALGALTAILVLGGCRKDEGSTDQPPVVNEEEVITTVRLHMENATQHVHLEWTDLDGDGGAAPVITADTLSVDSVYEVEVELLNESVSPAVDVSAEVADEGVDHQFFFQVSGTGTTFAYADADANGNPIGLAAVCTAGPSGTGTLTLTLRHQPDKYATGVSDGDITNAGGETDVEVTFPLVVD